MTVRALIVDDEAAIVRSLERVVKSHGHVCDTAGDIATAGGLLGSNHYDYLLLDMNLPLDPDDLDGRRENGMNFIGRIREMPGRAELPIIVITGEDRGEAEFFMPVLRAGGLNFTDYVQKPLGGDKIDEKIRWAMQVKKAEVQPVVSASLFVKRGQVWAVRFRGGDEFFLEASLGAAYLHILLTHPNEHLTAATLECRVNQQPQQYQLPVAVDATDKSALAAYQVRFDELKSEKQTAQKRNDPALLARIEKEMADLARQVEKDRGRGGRIRQDVDERERIRKRVGKAIRATLKIIAGIPAGAELAAHLAAAATPRCLSLGKSLIYAPPGGLRWNIEV